MSAYDHPVHYFNYTPVRPLNVSRGNNPAIYILIYSVYVSDKMAPHAHTLTYNKPY